MEPFESVAYHASKALSEAGMALYWASASALAEGKRAESDELHKLAMQLNAQVDVYVERMIVEAEGK